MSINSNLNKYDKLYVSHSDSYKRHGGIKTRWDFAISKVREHASQEILDFGCGDGTLFNEYKNANVGVIHGVDVSSLRRNRALERFPDAIINESIDYLTKESVDTIVCLDVLDHLDNPVELIQKFYEILSGGGILIGSVPNYTRIDRRIKMLFGHVPRTSNLADFIHPDSLLIDGGKLGYYSKSDIRKILVKAGFNEIEFFCYGRTRWSNIGILSGTISWTAKK